MLVIVRYTFLMLFLLAGVTVSSAVTANPLVTNPVPGTQLAGGTETFQWSANGASVSEWWLYVGTSVGGKEIHDSGSIGGALSATVSGLPTDGSTVWVRLWYVSGSWQYIDFQYSTAAGAVEPAIIAPAPGAQLAGATETFQWSANNAVVSGWTLTVGASVGGNDYYDSGSLGGATLSATVTSLPVDGNVVWVRLQYFTDQLYSIDYQYIAAVGTSVPAIITPAPGAQLAGTTETFQWSANGASVS